MRILQISDTHNRHQLLTSMPAADVLIHCGDFTDMGTEEEVLDFLNWYISLPYPHKIFIVGNHDLCLWEAESLIPKGVDVLVTHEPPIMILDESNNTHWGNSPLRSHVMRTKPKYHLFGHVHSAYGIEKHEDIVFSNGSSLDDYYEVCHSPRLITL